MQDILKELDFTQEEIDSLNRPMCTKEIVSLINNLSNQKAPSPDCLTGKL